MLPPGIKKNLSPAFKVITVFSTYCPSGTWKKQHEKKSRTSGKDKHIPITLWPIKKLQWGCAKGDI